MTSATKSCYSARLVDFSIKLTNGIRGGVQKVTSWDKWMAFVVVDFARPTYTKPHMKLNSVIEIGHQEVCAVTAVIWLPND